VLAIRNGKTYSWDGQRAQAVTLAEVGTSR
jgi:hypothetical protein